MLLLQLPDEILSQIFDYVGSTHFQQNPLQLTICKEWSKFACTARYQDCCLTETTVQRLMSSPYKEEGLDLLKNSLETLMLDLKIFDDVDTGLSLWDRSRGLYIPASRAKRSTVCAAEINDNLLRLATVTRQAQKLRTLRIRANCEKCPLLHYENWNDFLYAATVRELLSVNRLTHLELDVCNTRLNQGVEHGEKVHICSSIAALLPTLRHLRVRMHSICPEALQVPQDRHELRLHTVIINLSLLNGSELTGSNCHATRCNTAMVKGGSLIFIADMEKQAQVLGTQMAAPKMVRVLTHTLPNFRMQAFDALTGKNVSLREGTEWGEDGDVIADEISDEESEIASLSSFGD